jgi:hypothetical protein
MHSICRRVGGGGRLGRARFAGRAGSTLGPRCVAARMLSGNVDGNPILLVQPRPSLVLASLEPECVCHCRTPGLRMKGALCACSAAGCTTWGARRAHAVTMCCRMCRTHAHARLGLTTGCTAATECAAVCVCVCACVCCAQHAQAAAHACDAVLAVRCTNAERGRESCVVLCAHMRGL